MNVVYTPAVAWIDRDKLRALAKTGRLQVVLYGEPVGGDVPLYLESPQPLLDEIAQLQATIAAMRRRQAAAADDMGRLI